MNDNKQVQSEKSTNINTNCMDDNTCWGCGKEIIYKYNHTKTSHKYYSRLCWEDNHLENRCYGCGKEIIYGYTPTKKSHTYCSRLCWEDNH